MNRVPTPKVVPCVLSNVTDRTAAGFSVGSHVSTMQSEGQASLFTVLLSSHVSGASIIPLPHTEEPMVVDVRLVVDVLGTGALVDVVEVELVDVVLGTTFVVDVVLDPGTEVELVVLVDVVAPNVELVLDDVLVVVGVGLV